MKTVVFSYRYMWKLKDNSSINFKIVTDTSDGLKFFEDSLKSLDNLESVAKEYLHEYDCSKIGVFESVYGGDVNEKV